MQHGIRILSDRGDDVRILLCHKHDFSPCHTSTERPKLDGNTSHECSIRYGRYTTSCDLYPTSYDDISRETPIRHRSSSCAARGESRHIYDRRFMGFIQGNRLDCAWTAGLLFHIFLSMMAGLLPIAIKLVVSNATLFQRPRHVEH